MTTIGIIGAGNIGSQLARLAVANGYEVAIANSREPATLDPLIAELGENARAAYAAEVAAAADIAVVTVPLKNYADVPVDPLSGKIVIDTNNYYPERDGHIPELDAETTTTAELLQGHLPTSKVVKAFNQISAADLATDGTSSGTPNRRALALAGNDEAAKKAVSELIDILGFDTVNLGALSEGWRVQRDTPAYNLRENANELCASAAARRYADMNQPPSALPS
jgi:predicted dinucleotide-binding enzyme